VSITSGVEGSSNDIRGNYMMLLVTQLQNQNPLEPMSNDEMTAQLAQLSQLEHLESMDATFQKALFAAEVNQAAGLIDKEVAFLSEDSNEAVSGRVGGVNMIDGKVMVTVGNQGIELDRILSIAK
jgi:flagellar basal-body rod modification protein FlgD